jgi:8-oxo-dGTP pyrophosphatase MutT (NUDIX family)
MDTGDADFQHEGDPERTSRWVLHSREVAYENQWMTVWHDQVVRPDGTPGVYGVVHFPTAGVWIAAIEDDRVLLVGQHRHPLGGAWSWELPAGKLVEGESTLEGAKRELAEETGYRAKVWRELTRFDLAAGVSDLHGACFEATDLTPGASSPDGTEDIDVRWVTFDDALELIERGVLTDAVTQTALFRIALDRRTPR